MRSAAEQPVIEAVIFDCDGTLVDSEVISMSVLISMMSDLGIRLTMDEAMHNYAGNELAVVLTMLEAKLGGPLPAGFLDQFRSNQLAELARSLQAMEGVQQVLDSLQVPFCVASNAPRNKVELCLKTTGLDHHFGQESTFSAYEIERWKPDPALFLHAASSLGVRPSACAVVEDSVFGVEAGFRANMHVVGFDPHGRLSSVRDDLVSVTRFRELMDLLPCGDTHR